MKESEFKSLGKTRQLAYINRLEEINRQKQELIEKLEKENKYFTNRYSEVKERLQVAIDSCWIE